MIISSLDPDVLFLGANGFIGRNLVQSLSTILSISNLYSYDRQNHLIKSNSQIEYFDPSVFFKKQKKLVIINLMKESHNASPTETIHANFTKPLEILESVSRKTTMVWIQVNSYYQFKYMFEGMDKDLYSKSRREFSELLRKEKAKNRDLKTLEVYLPHVYGFGERQDRLFAKLRHGLKCGEEVLLTSGRQYLPIIQIGDCVRAMCEILSNINMEKVYVAPEAQKMIRDYIRIINQKSERKLKVEFNSLPDRENEFFSFFNFPKEVYVWQSKIKENFVDYVTG
mgnify:CR=1 FL=1